MLFDGAASTEKGWDIPLVILAVFVPPRAVFFKVGLINIDFIINVCLTILAWFPGRAACVVRHRHPAQVAHRTDRHYDVRRER